MNKLGAYYTVFNEIKATEFSLQQLHKHYPDINTYLVSDGGSDFSYLEKTYPNLRTQNDIDTLSLKRRMGPWNFLTEENQADIKTATLATFSRLEKAIPHCNSEYIIMSDPDTIVRGQLTIPNGSKLLGSRVNSPLPDAYRDVIKSVPGAIDIIRWGATPTIFHVETYLKALKKFNETPNLLDRLAQAFYSPYAHDVLFPTLFALVGYEEEFNPDITECTRDPAWRINNKPLLHQFKELYP